MQWKTNKQNKNKLTKGETNSDIIKHLKNNRKKERKKKRKQELAKENKKKRRRFKINEQMKGNKQTTKK